MRTIEKDLKGCRMAKIGAVRRRDGRSNERGKRSERSKSRESCQSGARFSCKTVAEPAHSPKTVSDYNGEWTPNSGCVSRIVE
jgi:hypothetical protein